MAEKYEVVVVGAGHNGLMAAAYLAKAGVNVCVLENHSKVGGAVYTDELTIPGFKHDLCSAWHGNITPSPVLVKDELGLLSKFGLKYLYPENLTGVIFDDGTMFKHFRDLDKTCESIASFSEHDAEAYRKFHDWSINLLEMMLMGMYNPPPSFGTQASMMDSSPEGRIMLRAQMLSAWDICEEFFESDKLKIVISRYASELMVNPFTKGTGLALFVFIPMIHKYGGGIPIGGSGQLSEALAKCIEHFGGTIKVSSTVKEFKLSGNDCTGVILKSGEEIDASKAVVSAINIRQMFPDMVPGAKLPDDFANGVKNLHHSNFMAFSQHLALNEVPDWKVGKAAEEHAWIEYAHTDLDEYKKLFRDMDDGIPVTSLDMSATLMPTKVDPSRAPEGKHTLYLYSFNPYFLKGGKNWDDIKQDVADKLLDNLKDVTTNMTDDNILGRAIYSPLDYERHNPALVAGDINHFGGNDFQMAGMRPLSGWHNYRTPIDKLYLVGASTAPGPGVSGAGRAGVQAVFEDLGLDFENVASKPIA